MAFVDGIIAAAVGAITGSIIVIAQRSITDIPTALLAVVATALLWKIKRLQEPIIAMAGAAIGMAVFP